MPDMTEFEQKFFETGELPPELAAQADPAPEPKIAPTQVAAPPSTQIEQPDAAEMLRRSLQEEQTRRIAAEVRLQDLEARATRKQPELGPDMNTDPLGAFFHKLEQTNLSVAELRAQLTQEQQQNNQRAQFQQFTNNIQQIKADFVKTAPDFDAAYAHVRATRAADLRTVGVQEADIPRVLAQEEFAIAQAAITNGRNPAEEIYKMAKRYGFAAKAAPAQKQTPTEKLDQLAKGAEAARSPAKGAPDTELSAEALQDADESALDKLVRDDKLWGKLVGGGQTDIFHH